MKPATWRGRCAHQLVDELIRLAWGDYIAEVSTAIDGGLGSQAVAVILATPRGPQRDYAIAVWAQRLLAGSPSGVSALVIPVELSAEDADSIAQLAARLQGGAP